MSSHFEILTHTMVGLICLLVMAVLMANMLGALDTPNIDVSRAPCCSIDVALQTEPPRSSTTSTRTGSSNRVTETFNLNDIQLFKDGLDGF